MTPKPAPQADPTHDDAAAHEAATNWAGAWGGFDTYAVAREALDTWACACLAWSDYLRRIATSIGPFALFDAGARLMTDSLEIYSLAAAERLKEGGVTTPLLNDA